MSALLGALIRDRGFIFGSVKREFQNRYRTSMLGALWLFLSVYIRQVENFAGAMNFVMFPMFFFSSALYPLWRLREGGSEVLYYVSIANPFTYAVELIRFALYGEFDAISALVVVGATVVFFAAAVNGYDPQRGMLRRAPQSQPA